MIGARFEFSSIPLINNSRDMNTTIQVYRRTTFCCMLLPKWRSGVETREHQGRSVKAGSYAIVYCTVICFSSHRNKYTFSRSQLLLQDSCEQSLRGTKSRLALSCSSKTCCDLKELMLSYLCETLP